MKKRRGVTVLGILSLVFLVATIALFVVNSLVPSLTGGNVPEFVGLNKSLWNCLTKFESASLKYNLFAWGIIVLFIGLLIPWLIVSLKRKRHSVWAFAILWLVVCYAGELEHIIFSVCIQQKLVANPWYLWIELGCFIVSKVLCIVLFIVDMVTGKVQPYAKEDNYEEAVVEPSPVVEAPAVEETPVEEALVEEEPIPEVAPVEEKKAPAKKVTKKPAKKANKKEEKKSAKAEKKAEVKKEEPVRNTEKKIYHISERKELNKWQVKAENSDKAVKLFNTQREAKTYALGLVDNDLGYIRLHTREGKIRKTSKRTYPEGK